MKIDKDKVKTHQEDAKIPIPKTLTPVKYGDLLRYATPQDKFLMTIGIIAALGNGASQPLFAVIFGQMTDSFASGDADKILDQAGKNALYFVYVGIGTFFLSFAMFSTWITSGEKQAIKIRKAYFQAILKQEVGWFDLVNPNSLNSKVADETSSVQEAIQEKAATFITTLSTFAIGFIIGYIRGWQLALVITASMPVLASSVVIVTAVVMKSIQVTTKSHSEANAVAEQALNAIKTVKMLDGENYECERYYDLLIKAARTTVEYSLYQGLCTGLIFGCLIWTYALGFYYGSKLIASETINSNSGEIYTAGDVMTIFFAILMGSFSLGQAGPCFQSFGKGKVAGAEIFQVIDRIPKIQSPQYPKSVKFNGEIKFQNVSFNYPTREDVQVLNNVSFSIQPGQKVALVGESGCGKSTIIQLVERFYDTLHGQILIGEEQIDVRELNLTDYRGQIGLVGQEPVLFAGSIKENLLYGKPNATNEELIDALKRVNAYDFVMKMDKKMDTYIGIGGNQISGGQKQRIAIARAILKKPKLLLLDEATSALDRTNEILIQKTLDQISQNITTIVIAHRLSTIQNADVIYVFDKGQIVEYGTHQELISKGGKYEALAKNQLMQPEQKKSKQMSIDPTTKEREQSISSINDLNQFQQDIVQNIQTEYKESVALIAPPQQEFQSIMFRLFKYNKEERVYFVSGLLAAVLNGSIFPLFSLFLSEMITVLLESNPKFFDEQDRYDKSVEVQDKADKICLYFFLFGLAFLLFQSLETVLLQVVAEFLTVKLRYDTFRKLLRMPIPFFDKAENNAGTLTARLSVDCKTIQGLTSTIIGFKVQNASSLITGMSIAFSSSWALTLVALSTAPISFLGRRLRQKHMSIVGRQLDGAYKDSGNLIMEAVTNIRTVYSFGNEEIILNAYNKRIQQPENSAAEQGMKSGFAFGFSQMQTSLVNALIFYMGAVLIKYQGLTVLGMFRAIFGISFATLGAARDSHFAGDADKGQQAAINLFGILDSTDEFQIEEASNSKRLVKDLRGEITFENVGFKYDTREKNLFENLNLHIPPGSKVSLVGPSGCGKSSVMQILMRFYNISSGRILLDGENIMDYDIRGLRKQLAIVSQEPVLFNGSIADNIRYNQQNISMDQIIDVSKQANAYNFIMSDEENPEDQGQIFGKGFEKQVGPKGSKVSGGQKQRIAIARALLRQQNILLLDEATSALDSLSEQLVQETLDQIMKNRTTIAIAHRFSTIKDSEIIYVFDSGKIVEQGKYDELMQMNGCFYRLAQGIQK